MASDQVEEVDELFGMKFRVDEELEFFTELAVHETQRWIESVTRKNFKYPDDPRKSLGNGILLLELLNALKPGSVKRINKLPTPLAGLDNINIFLQTCQKSFGISSKYLFDACDLEDLSQRAIAESDYLKQEVDRRLRNVVVSIYWLGRQVCKTYDGPQLDFSAFSALVTHHGNDLIPDNSLKQNSWEEYSSAYGSGDSTNRGSFLQDSIVNEPKHIRDSSYDSLGSYGRTSDDSQSFDEHIVESMPVRSDMSRYGIQSSQSKSGTSGRQSNNSSALYEDKGDSMYRSGSDISQDSHTRTSSFDSLDGSYHGSHSRHSSGSTDGHTTRPKTQTRKTSSSSASANPLQFIKVNRGAHELAKQAAEQMKSLSETRKFKQDTLEHPEIIKKEDETDWQAHGGGRTEGEYDWVKNLSSWKNRRKSTSATIYQQKEEREKETEKESRTKTAEDRPQTKTFKEIVDERNRRKSTGRLGIKTYPLDDDDEWREPTHTSTPSQKDKTLNSRNDDDVFRKVEVGKTESSPSSRLVKQGSTEYVAPWAMDSSDDEKGTSQDSSHSEEMSRVQHHSNYDIQPSKNRATPDHRDKNGVSERDSQTISSSHRQQNHDSFDSRRNRFETSDIPTAPVRTSKIGSDVRNTVNSENVSHRDSQKSNKFDNTNKNIDNSLESSPSERSRQRSDERKIILNDSWEKKSIERKNLSSKKQNSIGFENENGLAFSMGSDKPTIEEKTDNAEEEKYIEKIVKLRLQPNDRKGFGFTVSGGIDKMEPLIVDRVTRGKDESEDKDGGIADVNELESQDKIQEINGKGVSHCTCDELKALIEDCRLAGKIEIKIKRKISEDDEDYSDEDDEDDDEIDGEESHPPKQNNSILDYMAKTPPRPETSPPKVLTRFEESPPKYPMLNNLQNDLKKDQDWLREELQQKTDINARKDESFSSEVSTPLSPDIPTQIVESKVYDGPTQTEVTYRDRVPSPQNVHKEEPVMDVETKVEVDNNFSAPPPSRDFISPTPSSQSDDSSLGPPDILRKWQRRRQPNVRTSPPDRRQSCALDWRSQKIEIAPSAKDDLALNLSGEFSSDLSQASLASSNTNFEEKTEQKRIEEWSEEQERLRQNGDSMFRVDTSEPVEQEKFEQDHQKLVSQYQDDVKKADIASKENEEKDRKIIEPETERMVQLEEKRRERMEKYHNQKNLINIAPENQVGSGPTPSSQLEPIVYKYQAGDPNFQQRERDVSLPEQNITASVQSSQPSVTTHHTRETDSIMLLEEERERIRQDERRKIEQERIAREQEEEKRLREKEIQLRLMEERIRREEERLKLEKAKIEHEKQLKTERENRPRPGNVSTNFRGRINSPPEHVLKSYSVDSSCTPHNFNKQPDMASSSGVSVRPGNVSAYREGGPKSPPHISNKSSSFSESTANPVVGAPQYSSSVRVEPPPVPSYVVEKAEITNTQPPPVNTKENTDKPGGSRLTREDMMLMNRKPTPLQIKPPEQQTQSSGPAGGIIREKPTRQEILSLNAVPKRKCWDANTWGGESQSAPKPPARRSEVLRREFPTTQEHWLVEEAERRRRANQEVNPRLSLQRHSVHSLYTTGPIRPVDDHTNRWRDDMQSGRSSASFDGSRTMPEQIRQTLLQKTSVQRTSPNQHLSEPVPQQPSHPQSLSQTLPRSFEYSSKKPGYAPVPAPRGNKSAVPPPPPTKPPRAGFSVDASADQISKQQVSGHQICSACNEKLGFGAAMVIESLNLQYHVQCFQCCVCHTSLSNGSRGADVRVRVNKLHCQNCYSNDEAGLKFSKV